MALVPLVHQPKPTHFSFSTHQSKSSISTPKAPQMALQNGTTKRAASLTIAAILCTTQLTAAANAFDFRLVAPDQTLEEAESGIRGHAKGLLKVKELLEEESWRAAQKELRKNSALLKQDIYTIIQNKPGIQRSELRKMYSNLFNSVTRLDYAARDEDVPRIWECYNYIVLALDNILARII